jgi:hypothetical protein
MYAQCETCGETVEAEITHNGVMQVGHYVHCGWGHMVAIDDLFESLSGGNPSEKSDGLQSDHRGISQARSSEGGNDGTKCARRVDPISHAGGQQHCLDGRRS